MWPGEHGSFKLPTTEVGEVRLPVPPSQSLALWGDTVLRLPLCIKSFRIVRSADLICFCERPNLSRAQLRDSEIWGEVVTGSDYCGDRYGCGYQSAGGAETLRMGHSWLGVEHWQRRWR